MKEERTINDFCKSDRKNVRACSVNNITIFCRTECRRA